MSTTSSEFGIDSYICMFGMGGLDQDKSLNSNDFRSTRISGLQMLCTYLLTVGNPNV